MKLIEIKNRFTYEIIYSHECENNTVKITIEKAVKDGANLYGANLYGANLEGANLDGAKMPIYCKWAVSQIDLETIKIGCKEKTISEWDEFFSSDEEFSTKRNTKEFIQIKASYEAMKAYINFLKANQ